VSTTGIKDWKELARREGDGLVVSLFWSRTAGRVTVTIGEQALGEELRIDVPGACALDAFYHPFAYAAGRDLGLSCATTSTSSGPERSAA
jgi:hypothetical protein